MSTPTIDATPTAPAVPTAEELATLLGAYDEWATAREALSESEGVDPNAVDSDDWHWSDDTGVGLAHDLASALAALTAPVAEPTAEHQGVEVTLTTSERDGAVLVIVDTPGLDRATGLRIDLNDGTVWDGNPESHTSGPPAPATPVPDDVLTVTYPSGRTLNVERKHLAWALTLHDTEPPSVYVAAVEGADTMAALNDAFDGIDARITRTPNPLAGFAIRAEEVGDPSVVCTTCQEVVCTAEDSDSLEVLAGTATDHHEHTWTFFGHWDQDELVIDVGVIGRHEDDRPDTEERPEGLWCDYGHGATKDEAQANALATLT